MTTTSSQSAMASESKSPESVREKLLALIKNTNTRHKTGLGLMRRSDAAAAFKLLDNVEAISKTDGIRKAEDELCEIKSAFRKMESDFVN